MTDPQPITFFGENIGFWIQTGAIVLSAIYAGRQVRLLRIQTDQNEIQAKRRATIDMVLDEKQDGNLVAARKKFAELRDSNNITAFACKPESEHPDENSAILAILNNYEFMAIGIREKALDEAIYRRMKNSLVIRDWEALASYVLEMRKKHKNPKLFVEFEVLAGDWADRTKYENFIP